MTTTKPFCLLDWLADLHEKICILCKPAPGAGIWDLSFPWDDELAVVFFATALGVCIYTMFRWRG